MIILTQMESNVYEAYLKLRHIKKVSAALNLNTHSVNRYMRALVEAGVMTYSESKGFRSTGKEYRVGTLYERQKQRSQNRNAVQMTDAELDWMLQHYRPRNRSKAAQALGRTRYEICDMAIQLKIDVDGRWNRAQPTQSKDHIGA